MSAAKFCSRCGVTKSHADFYKDASRNDGLCRLCKDCDAARTKGRKMNPEQLAKHRVRCAARVFDPKKIRANNLVLAAINRRELFKWPVCAMPECEEKRVEAHHADYDNPLGVTWLCAKHHRLAHHSIRSEA